MRKLTAIPIIGAAIAGGIIALVIAGNSHTTRSITTTIVQQTPSSQPTSFSNSGSAGESINTIYKNAAPGVVDIQVLSKSPGNSLLGGGSQEQGGEGAGVVYDSNGDILTDEHVVANATKVTVMFQDGKKYPAKVLGTDASTDVGVIKVSAPSSELHPIKFANSDTAKVGDPVVAIGSPFGLPETVTSGIVSQTQRAIRAPNQFTIANAIQTDAAINPGNSGGPLLNANGEVLGLNDQIETDSTNSATGEGQNAGIGFATPSNDDVKVANTIISGKKVQHAYIGISLPEAISAPAEVRKVDTGGPAAKGGLELNDVITKVDNTPITSANQFIETLGNFAPGQTVTLTVQRQGQTKTLKVTLVDRPASVPSAG